jgi:hypothetical protein
VEQPSTATVASKRRAQQVTEASETSAQAAHRASLERTNVKASLEEPSVKALADSRAVSVAPLALVPGYAQALPQVRHVTPVLAVAAVVVPAAAVAVATQVVAVADRTVVAVVITNT